MESPPPQKGEYELARDKHVAEVHAKFGPLFNSQLAPDQDSGKKRECEGPNRREKGEKVVRRSSRQRGLRGRSKREKRTHGSCGAAGDKSKMSSDRNSSSEATESNEEAIAREDALFDSSDNDMEEPEPLVDRRTKRPKPTPILKSPRKFLARRPSSQPPPPPDEPEDSGWQWQPGKWLPKSPPPRQPLRNALGQHSYQTGCDEVERTFEHTSRRKKRTAYEFGREETLTGPPKPNFVEVLEGGEVDPGCSGKNAWDLAVRNFVPKVIDMSIVDWSKHKPHTLQKLRELLDNEFEYVGSPLSMAAFRTTVTKFMKSERSRLKSKWLSSTDRENSKPPVHIDPDQWERLIQYWNTASQKEKSAQMAVARQSVKGLSAVGRKGKAGVEASLRERRSTSPGITDIADVVRSSGVGSLTHKVESSLQCQIDALKKDVHGKFEQIMATTEEMRSMFQEFMWKSKQGDDGSPSLTHSALEHQSSRGQQGFHAAEVLQNITDGVPAGAASMLQKGASATCACALPKALNPATVTATHAQVTLSSDSEISVKDPPSTHGAAIPLHWKVEGRKSPPAKPTPATTEVMVPGSLNNGSAYAFDIAEGAEVAAAADAATEVEKPPEDASADPIVDAAISLPTEASPTVVIQGTHVDELNLAATKGNVGVQEENAATKEREATAEDDGEPKSADLLQQVPLLPSVVSNLPTLRDEVVESDVEESVPLVRPDPLQKKGKKPAKSPSKVRTQKPSTRAKTVANKDANPKKFKVGDEVFLMNPRAVKQKVALGTISGVPGEHQFHGQDIPRGWWRVDVRLVLQEGVSLMFPNEKGDQYMIQDVKGANAMWGEKNLKLVT